ncbi:MAG: hypothetical protein ABFD18_08030 [Syntrophomonas sp.]
MPTLSEYVKAAMSQALYKKLDNESIYGEIAECPGVWANENSMEECQNTLRSSGRMDYYKTTRCR